MPFVLIDSCIFSSFLSPLYKCKGGGGRDRAEERGGKETKLLHEPKVQAASGDTENSLSLRSSPTCHLVRGKAGGSVPRKAGKGAYPQVSAQGKRQVPPACRAAQGGVVVCAGLGLCSSCGPDSAGSTVTLRGGRRMAWVSQSVSVCLSQYHRSTSLYCPPRQTLQLRLWLVGGHVTVV